uniref:Uncharacterized protein n=1 Tax=Amphimedon queenslandica TaxID=400682 RepID=A0A1X7V1Z0_AMPQE
EILGFVTFSFPATLEKLLTVISLDFRASGTLPFVKGPRTLPVTETGLVALEVSML